MTTVDTRAWLASLLGHLNLHPHVADSLSLAHGNCAEVQLYPYSRSDNSHLAALAEWAATLTDPQPIRITYFNRGERRAHLSASGHLSDGTEITVVAVLWANEVNRLAANTTVAEGATFPVELLHRLVDHHAAEQVPA